MKFAYWGIGLFVFGIFGLFLISLFGDITVTNQQDYTLLKNSVEAAMYDSVDQISYENGFCLCTNKDPSSGVYKFDDADDYVIQTLASATSSCNTSDYRYCEKKIGEVKLSEEIFAESFVRRFAQNVKGNKNYKILIQEVIEYPPKVSVEVRSYSNYNMFDSTSATFDDSDFDISNKIDSIFEYK